MVAQPIPINTITLSTTNPRKETTEDGLKDLAASIQAQGQLTPIIVRPLPANETNGHLYELVCGSRRLAAMQMLGESDIIAMIRDIDDMQAVEIQIVENLQRQDVTPIEEAEAYMYLRAQWPSSTLEDIAKSVGKRPEYVARRMTLLTLIEPWRQKMREGTLTLEQALYISRFDDKEQETLYDSLDDEHEVFTMGDLREVAERDVLNDLSRAIFDTCATYGNIGPCTSCPMRSSAQALLFDDMQATDNCLDPACWEEKRLLHVEQTVTEFKSKGMRLAAIKMYGGESPLAEGLPTVERYQVDDATDEDIQAGRAFTMIELYDRSIDFGKTRLVALRDERMLEEVKPAGNAPTEFSLKQRETKLNREINNRYRIAKAQALLAKVREESDVSMTLPLEVLRSMVRAAFLKLNADETKTLFKILNVTVEKSEGYYTRAEEVAFDAYLQTNVARRHLVATLYTILLVPRLLDQNYGPGDETLLVALYGYYDADASEALDAIDKEFEPREKRLAKAREKLAATTAA